MMTLHLLILEDNPDDAELAVKELERKGFNVKWTRVDTEEAFRKGLSEKPDLILVDYSLPSFDGLAALEVHRHRQLHLDIPIIVVSGTIGEDVVVECMKLGATDYVLKDNLSRLGPVVKRALEEIKIYRKSKQAEEALRESEERFRTIFNSINDAVFIHDVETGAILDVNSTMCEMYGYSREEVYQLDVQAVSSGEVPYAQQDSLEWIKKAVAGKPQVFEWMAKHKSGHLFWVEVSMKKAVIGLQERLLVVVRDITERKQAEEALRRAHENTKTILKKAPFGVAVIGRDRKIKMVNDTALKMAGMGNADIMLGKDCGEYLCPLQQNECPILDKGQQVDNSERIFRRKDGKEIPIIKTVTEVNIGGEDVLLETFVDNTERKKMEDALRESEERLKTILDSIQAGIVTIDAETHIIIDANPAAIRMIGVPEKQVIGHVCHDYICPAEKGRCPITDLGQKVDNSERILLTANREEVPILKTVTTMVLGGKQCLLDTFIDITEKKKLEDQLRQSQKMEAIGTLAGGVAHDFNNILTVIIGNAQLALMDVIKDESLRKKIEEINKAGERAASLTRQLLAFSRKQIVQPKILDINELLTDIEKMVGRLIGEDIELLTVPDPALWQVEIDPGQIEQVIINLAINAKDAMSICADSAAGRPHGGKLTIETANADLNENYFREHGIEGEKSGHYVVLAVSDTGIGMDKETREHIFEPFFTTKEVGKGTGLGLSTIYGIVKQSNGFIWVYSEPGQGSTFKIYLPKVKGDAEPEEKEQTSVDDLSGSETVLIVEDNDSLRNFAQKALQSYGYRVLVAENGEDVLRVCKEHDGQIHLMITDVVMPKMGGREAADRLQPLYPQMKVIYMSGYTDDAIVHHGVLEPGLNFLEKPFSPESLGKEVRQVLDAEK